MRWMLAVMACASVACGQWIQAGDVEINRDTFEIREADMTLAQGTGILGGSISAAELVRSYQTKRVSFYLFSNSNGKRNKAGDNYGIGGSLHGAGSRDPVNQWGWGWKSFGENPSINAGQIQSLNNAPQYGFRSRSRAISNYPANVLRFREDVASVYTDLGLTDTDLTRTLCPISTEWSADYFKNNVQRDGTTSGTPPHRWGLIADRTLIDGDVNTWIEIMYAQVGTGGTVGADTKGDFYLSASTVTDDQGAGLADGGAIIRDGDGGSLSIAGAVADSKLRMAFRVSALGPLSDDPDWLTDTNPGLALFGLTAFNGRFAPLGGRIGQDFASGFSLVSFYLEGGKSMQDFYTAVNDVDEDALAQFVEADALAQLRGDNGNDGEVIIGVVANEIFNSAGGRGAAQLSADGINNVNTVAGFTAELDRLQAKWASVFTKAQTLLDTSAPGTLLKWCILLPNDHMTDGNTNKTLERALVDASGDWANAEDANTGVSYLGVLAIDPDQIQDFTGDYDSPTTQQHLGTNEATSQPLYIEKWDSIFDAAEAATAASGGGSSLGARRPTPIGMIVP